MSLQTRTKDKIWVCHCNQANEASKKLYIRPSITDHTKEMHFIRAQCSRFYCIGMWVQYPVILQQRMLTMPQLSDELKGRLLSPAGCGVHSQTDCAKICWEKLNTSPSSCQPFTSLFVSYSYALCFRPCPSGTSTVISSRFLLCLWQCRSHPSGASRRFHSLSVCVRQQNHLVISLFSNIRLISIPVYHSKT